MDVVIGLATITLDPRDGHAVAIFLHAPSGRCLPLWVDDIDAAALAGASRGEQLSSSSSAALTWAAIRACGGAIDRIELHRVHGGVLRAAVVVVGAFGPVTLPSRASTAAALAALSGAPLLVDDGLLAQVHARLQEAAARVGHDDGVDAPAIQTATERWNQLLAHMADRLVDERPG